MSYFLKIKIKILKRKIVYDLTFYWLGCLDFDIYLHSVWFLNFMFFSGQSLVYGDRSRIYSRKWGRQCWCIFLMNWSKFWNFFRPLKIPKILPKIGFWIFLLQKYPKRLKTTHPDAEQLRKKFQWEKSDNLFGFVPPIIQNSLLSFNPLANANWISMSKLAVVWGT